MLRSLVTLITDTVTDLIAVIVCNQRGMDGLQSSCMTAFVDFLLVICGNWQCVILCEKKAVVQQRLSFMGQQIAKDSEV